LARGAAGHHFADVSCRASMTMTTAATTAIPITRRPTAAIRPRTSSHHHRAGRQY
jgi:hypothetical protein